MTSENEISECIEEITEDISIGENQNNANTSKDDSNNNDIQLEDTEIPDHSPPVEDEFTPVDENNENANNIIVSTQKRSIEEPDNLSDNFVRQSSLGTDGKPPDMSDKSYQFRTESETKESHQKDSNTPSNEHSEVMNEGKISLHRMDFMEEDHQDENQEFKLSQEERNNLIAEYQRTYEEMKNARELNIFLQARLSEYFRKKRTENLDPSQSIAGPSETIKDSDLDAKLDKLMGTLNDLREQYKNTQISYKSTIDTLKTTCAIKQKEVEEAYNEFVRHRMKVALTSVSARTGKNMTQREIDALLNQEAKKEAQVATVRMENLRLLHTMKKLEDEVKSKEQLAGGLHLIDFEQLKIENQTHNEKIEERYEELVKLKRKISTTVQILTHFKEKNESTIREKNKKIEQLKRAEHELKMKRDKLARTKQTRDKLKSENEKLDTTGGLLIKPKLLVDFEETLNETEIIRDKQRTVHNLAESYRNQIDRLQNKMEQLEF